VGEGPENPKWLAIGEGPGRNEVAMGRPFIGASGQMVNKALQAIRRPRDQIWVDNSTLCQPTPYATDEDKKLARKCCEPRFRAQIMQWPDRPILALGAIAARAFLGTRFSINEMAGSYHWIEKKKWGARAVIPTIHPAAILRGGGGIGGAHAPDLAFWNLIYDMAKIDAIANGKDIVFREDDIATEYEDPKRAEQLVRQMVLDARACGMIATDTETYVEDERKHSALQPLNAKMSALGLATEGWGLSVAWNIMTPYAKRLVANVFADYNVRKVMHNRLYDRPVLARHGLPVYGPNDDTMLRHHSAFPGLSHSLQRVATQYFAITPWKAEFRKGHDTPENLTRYNAKDTLVTARIDAPLTIALKKTQSERTYEIDLKSTEVAQWMHEKGVPVSREVNQQLYNTFLENMTQARQVMEDAAYDPAIQKKLWDRLAFEQAKRIRKADPIDDFEARHKTRLEEIQHAHNKGRWQWKIGSGEHVAAYLKARGVPLYFMTPTGRTSTKKEILEQFSHLPEVQSLLDYRENQKMFSTFVYRFFDRYDVNGNIVKYGYADEDSRIHPRWSVHKITGRWGAEDPMCFDGDTEILTENGWVRFDALPRNVRVAQYHLEDRIVDFVHPTDYIERHHASSMVRLQGKNIDLVVTPDHRFPVRPRPRRRCSNPRWRDIRADAWKKEYQLPVAGRYVGGSWAPSPAYVSFVCAAQADGSWNGYGWYFGLSKTRKIERLRNVLDTLGLSYRLTDKTEPDPFREGTFRTRKIIYVHKSEVGDEVAQRLGLTTGQTGKGLFGAWVLDLTATMLNQFALEIEFWDGCPTREGQFASSQKQSADWAQIAFVLTDRRAKIRPYNSGALQTKTNWQVDVARRTRTKGATWYIGTDQAVATEIPGSKIVYCVSVPSSYILVRRNGKVVVAGNCQNWPKANKKKGRPNLRSQVVAPDGRIFVGFDFAQLEARIIALYSGDPFLCDIFWNHKDIHSEFARVVWPNYDSLPIDQRKVLRDTIKRPEYGAFYGGQIDTLWKNVVKDYPDVKLQDIAKMVTLMTAKMPGVTLWHNKLLRDVAVAPHEIRSAVYGRRRCFPLGNADINDVYNFPVQCLRGDQRVLTTNGWKPIEQLVPGVDTLMQPSGRTTTAFKLRSTGTRDIYEVQTKGRRIYCTKEHRFLTYVRGGKVAWMKTRYLEQGRHLAVDFTPAQGGYDPPNVNPAIAEALGALVGDGNYTRRGFVITCTTKRYANHIKRLVETSWPDMVCRVRSIKKQAAKHKQLWSVSSEGQLASARLKVLGLQPATAKAKSLPTWVETATLPTRVALLKGLFDSDGGHTGVDVSFTTTSWELARTTQRLLLSVGIDARHYTLKRSHRIIIRPTSRPLFDQLIGFTYSEKRQRLQSRQHKNPIDRLPSDLVQHVARLLKKRLPKRDKGWTKLEHARLTRALQGSASQQQMEKIFSACHRCAEIDDIEQIYTDGLKFFWEEIVSVRRVGRAQTFELEIEDDHGYVAEGFVTHNSTASDVMATGMLRIVPRLQQKYINAFPILQIHDAMVFECDEDDGERLKEDVRECFEQEHTFGGVTIPFPVDPAVGKSWAQV
jgi:uracil-DNA glycosylase family 4